MCQWWVFVLFLLVFWGGRARKNGFHAFCLLRKKGLKSMYHFTSPKMYLCPEASNVLSLYVLVPPTLCCLVFHCEFLPFLKQLFQYGTGFISSITLWSFVQFLPGLILCQAYLLFAIAKTVSSHTYPASNLSPNNQHKLIKKINILPCCSWAPRLQWSCINWFDYFISMSSCQSIFCIIIFSYIVIVYEANIFLHVYQLIK